MNVLAFCFTPTIRFEDSSCSNKRAMCAIFVVVSKWIQFFFIYELGQFFLFKIVFGVEISSISNLSMVIEIGSALDTGSSLCVGIPYRSIDNVL